MIKKYKQILETEENIKDQQAYSLLKLINMEIKRENMNWAFEYLNRQIIFDLSLFFYEDEKNFYEKNMKKFYEEDHGATFFNEEHVYGENDLDYEDKIQNDNNIKSDQKVESENPKEKENKKNNSIEMENIIIKEENKSKNLNLYFNR